MLHKQEQYNTKRKTSEEPTKNGIFLNSKKIRNKKKGRRGGGRKILSTKESRGRENNLEQERKEKKSSMLDLDKKVS